MARGQKRHRSHVEVKKHNTVAAVQWAALAALFVAVVVAVFVFGIGVSGDGIVDAN